VVINLFNILGTRPINLHRYSYSHLISLSYHILVFLPSHFSSMEQMLMLMFCKLLCYIRAQRNVRDSLSDNVARTVACSIVGSRLDYCNSLLAGTSESNQRKLQRVQNTLARVTLRPVRSHHTGLKAIALASNWTSSFKLAILTNNVNLPVNQSIRVIISVGLWTSPYWIVIETISTDNVAARGFRQSIYSSCMEQFAWQYSKFILT